MPSHGKTDRESPVTAFLTTETEKRRRKQSNPLRAIQPKERTARQVPIEERTVVLRFLKRAEEPSDASDKFADNGKAKRSRPRGQPLDISGMPMLERLSTEEQKLSSIVRVTPEQYLKIKETMVGEAKKVFVLKKSHATRLFRIDSNKTGRLYEYFVDMGWIKNGSTPITA